jgi:hypothetical protein
MKTWEIPKLVVLVRNKPEEAVLGACKSSSTEPAGPHFSPGSGCWFLEPGISWCSGLTVS